jgi:hypothetical protein
MTTFMLRNSVLELYTNTRGGGSTLAAAAAAVYPISATSQAAPRADAGSRAAHRYHAAASDATPVARHG